ncbi:Anti-sigma-W factor RsiW [compost metagenome]
MQNGEARVYGDVEGNVTVIDGSYYQASTAHIAGQVKSIDQTLDWIWYKVTDLFGGPSSP